MATQSDAQLREIIANYYGMISLVDHQVGRILSALDDAGLADNTLVVFTSDHGEFLGDHGLMLKGPMHYEGLLRVGLIMRGPGIVRAVAPYWKTGLVGACLSVGAYWIAIWAMTQAPIASVAALRETSILVVMLLSARVLKEHVSMARLAGAALIVAGAVMIRLG